MFTPNRYVNANPVLYVDPSGEIQIASGSFTYKYLFEGKEVVAGPAVNNGYPRWWQPAEPAGTGSPARPR